MVPLVISKVKTFSTVSCHKQNVPNGDAEKGRECGMIPEGGGGGGGAKLDYSFFMPIGPLPFYAFCVDEQT